jgi:dienelactone hydrolase
MVRHQEQYYGGVAWANELARRGYVVLVHDTFTFGSRRMGLADLPGNIRNNLVEVNPETEDEIQRYNQFAADHEHVIAKSLFSAGMTWPGVFVFDDQRAVTTWHRDRTWTRQGSAAAAYRVAVCAR